MSNVYDSHRHNEVILWNIFHKCGIKPQEEEQWMVDAIFKIAEEMREASEAGFADAKQSYIYHYESKLENYRQRLKTIDKESK